MNKPTWPLTIPLTTTTTHDRDHSQGLPHQDRHHVSDGGARGGGKGGGGGFGKQQLYMAESFLVLARYSMQSMAVVGQSTPEI